MNNKRNSLLKLMTSIVLVAVLCLGVAFPALAADKYSEGYPAEAAITKILKIPTGTEIPNLTFDFVFTAVDFDGDPNPTLLFPNGMPSINPVSITYPAGQGVKTVTESNGETQYVAIGSEDFIGSTFVNGPEGVYRYLVEEVADTNSNLTDKEGIVYSTAKYYIDIYVEKDDNGDYFVRFVNGVIIGTDKDEWYEDKKGYEDGDKLNPDPDGDGEIGGNDTIEDDFSQLVFTNRYWKTTGGGGTGEDPDYSALTIKKIVTGNNAPQNYPFDFQIIVTTPEIAVGHVTGQYKAFIVDAFGQASTNPIIFDSTLPGTFQLKDGESLVFVDLEVGAKVEVMEFADGDFRPAYERTFANAGEYIAPGRGEDWGFPSNDDAGPHFTEEGTGANFNEVIYTNTFRPTAPTGIIVDELPYIILIGAAAAGLVLFIALKMRKKGEIEGEPVEQEF